MITMLPNKSFTFILLLLLCTNGCLGFLEVAVGFISYAYQKMSCGSRCCTEKQIPANFGVLRANLRSKLFGQPWVESTIVNALKYHWNSESDKALTMSFHGGPGVGKNFVSNLIQEALYLDGTKSPHVHNFNGRLHFPEVKDVDLYKRNLVDWIRGNVSNCPKQLFVFDEVHHMPPGVLDAIKPFIDYHYLVDGIDFRKSIFIFLSNTGTKIINEKMFNLWNMGINKDDMRLSIFDKMIVQGAFNENGGFHHSETIKSNLIDHYVPFLPLMKADVIKCIKGEFKKFDGSLPTENQIEEVMEFLDWGPDIDNEVFAKTGCKRISQKVRTLF